MSPNECQLDDSGFDLDESLYDFQEAPSDDGDDVSIHIENDEVGQLSELGS
jgi:hypothetical protein